MRFVSLLVTLLILAWVVLQQMGGTSSEKVANNTAIQAEAKAKAVQAQVLQSYQQQAQTISRTESGDAPSQTPEPQQ